MRGRIALVLSLLLVVGACGGGGAATTTVAATTTTAAATTTTTEPAGFEVVSEDGDVTVEVPFDAMASDPGITITLLTGDQYPPELAAAADDPEARIYDLGPEGTEFAAPVTVTRRIDAARFGAISPTMVPAVVLMSYDAATSTYELYDDLRVTRDGDDIFVSGTTTHFSPSVAVNLGGFVEMQLDDYHLGYKTELGTSLQIGYKYYGSGMVPIDPPLMVEPIGFSRSAAFTFGDITTAGSFQAAGDGVDLRGLDVMCDKIAMARPRLGAKVTIDPAAPESGFHSNLISVLIPTLAQIELTMKIVADVYCLDPVTAFMISLAVMQVSLFTDHPGGEEYIPAENYYGGLSGFKLMTPFVPGLAGAWAGLICDNDRNGRVDPTDTFFRPWELMRDGDDLTYVSPLYGYGDYFVYFADASQFSAAPEGEEWAVSAALSAFGDKYTGTGRFETSIGILGSGGNPFVYQVGPEESEATAEVEVQPFITRLNYQF
ncbi:MAG TPA: hypothetical protein VFY15_06245 [Acidimicrobiia bacterium]|nr:hypothetical protein [Acidimicrobiia bacterium]